MPDRSELDRRILRRLDSILLPFLALLFLFNSIDKSNIGNAESAHFSSDIGLEPDDVNTAVALCFAFFVALQPLGAGLGRKYGMVRWVPSTMAMWGLCTAMHIWIRARWQLFTLRIIIGTLEAGFYPVTVSYLSLFYTRYEFARRLSLFYGQAAVAGAVGGILSYMVFSHFPKDGPGQEGDHTPSAGWKSWQILFLLEGCSTTVLALAGLFLLPESPRTAWFLSKEQQKRAEQRIVLDRLDDSATAHNSHIEEDTDYGESRGLLDPAHATLASEDVTHDRGISPHDVVSAFLSPKIYHILLCNILSAVPVYAFSVFLPLVLAPLTQTPNPALVNLLTAPPYVCGAITLYGFASYSDRTRHRLAPIMVGLCFLIFGLTLVVLLPRSWAIPRYLALNVLLSATFIASPLTVVWISENTPSPGKRAILLGINGWGNLAGLFAAFLFRPKYAKTGYLLPFWWTLLCVGVAAAGYLLFWRNLLLENQKRQSLLKMWDEDEIERERSEGRGPVKQSNWLLERLSRKMAGSNVKAVEELAHWLADGVEGGREGDERITFMYST